MELQDVQFEVQDGVGIITMNRPERLNASSSDMTQGMIHILENLTPDVRAIVLTGAGRAFSAGGDVKGMNESLNNPDGRPAWRRSHAEDVVSVAFWNCDRPIIAAVNGHSVGVGLSYACMCDIRIASDKAQFGALWIRSVAICRTAAAPSSCPLSWAFPRRWSLSGPATLSTPRKPSALDW